MTRRHQEPPDRTPPPATPSLEYVERLLSRQDWIEASWEALRLAEHYKATAERASRVLGRAERWLDNEDDPYDADHAQRVIEFHEKRRDEALAALRKATDLFERIRLAWESWEDRRREWAKNAPKKGRAAKSRRRTETTGAEPSVRVRMRAAIQAGDAEAVAKVSEESFDDRETHCLRLKWVLQRLFGGPSGFMAPQWAIRYSGYCGASAGPWCEGCPLQEARNNATDEDRAKFPPL